MTTTTSRKTAAKKTTPAKKTATKRAAASNTAPPDDAGTMTVLPVADLEPHPANPRQSLRDVEDLASLIAAQGVLVPLTVQNSPGGSGYQVLMGHRRLAAAQLLALAEVPCIVRPGTLSDADALTLMLGENDGRDDLTPIEEATAYEQLALLGLSSAAIASRTGRKTEQVDQRRRLLDLPDAAKARIQARQLTLEQATQLAEFADDEAAVDRLLRALDSYGDIRAAYERERMDRADERARRERRAVLSARLNEMGVPERAFGGGFKGSETLSYLRYGHTVFEKGISYELIEWHAGTGCSGPIEGSVQYDGHGVTLLCATHPQPGPDDAPRRDPGPAVQDVGPATAGISGAGSEEAEKRQAALAQREAECQASAAVRVKYLAALTRGETPLTDGMRDAITSAAALWVLAEGLYFEADDVTEWLRPAPDDGEQDDSDVDDDGSAQEFVKSINDPQRVFLAAFAAAVESNLRRPYAWDELPGKGDWVAVRRDYLALLGGPLGYEWTPWESAELDRAQKAIAAAGSDEPDA